MLSTFGGDAHAAYRVTRHLRNRYRDGVILFIPTLCKSAGTLVAIGADELVMSPHGELGPLDVQVSERDEVGEFRSGLIPSQALETVREEAFAFFEDYFLKLRTRSGLQITTRTAAEIASQMTVGLLEPFVGQIDPLRVADIRLSMRIAKDYGERLRTENVRAGTIDKLVYQYPSHSSVLDWTEATKLFEEVREPTQAESELADNVASMVDESLYGEQALAVYLSGAEFLALLETPDDYTDEGPHDGQNHGGTDYVDEDLTKSEERSQPSSARRSLGETQLGEEEVVPVNGVEGGGDVAEA